MPSHNSSSDRYNRQSRFRQTYLIRLAKNMSLLYKYVTSQRALTCIPGVGDGTLRATQPAALNDPFECAVSTPYNIPYEADENRLISDVLTEINESKKVIENDVRRARIEHGSLFTRQLLAEQLSTRFGIVSFSTDPFHPLMWSHYTSDRSGFVVGYDMAAIGRLAIHPGWLRDVAYHDRPPPIIDPIVLVSPDSNLPILLSIKRNHWSYEKEWRLIVELNRTIGTGDVDYRGQSINLIQVPNEAVVSVFYTERTPQQSVSLIRGRLADSNNRYGTATPRKLIRSVSSYSYEECPADD